MLDKKDWKRGSKEIEIENTICLIRKIDSEVQKKLKLRISFAIALQEHIQCLGFQFWHLTKIMKQIKKFAGIKQRFTDENIQGFNLRLELNNSKMQ